MANAGSAGGAVVLNTPETSFAVLDCRQVNVGSSDLAPVSVQQTILAAVDTHAPCYALATDVLEVCFETPQ